MVHQLGKIRPAGLHPVYGPGFTEFTETHSQSWTDYPELTLYEQTRLAPDGHAVTLLWAEMPDEDEEDDLPELDMPQTWWGQR